MAYPDPEPPPRARWEEPHRDAWVSPLGGLGLEALTVMTAVASAVGAWRAFALARRLGAVPAQSGRFTLAMLWCLVGLLALTLVLLVWRRLGGIALVGAMLTDHGRVARFGGRPPIWLDDPPEPRLRLAHLSDLHVTEGDHVRLVERQAPGGNAVLERLLARPELREADAIVITGDITDRGTALAWRCFLDMIGPARIADRLILVPGNHDLALVDSWDGLGDRRGGWRRHDRFGIVQLANLLKFGSAFAETAGGRRGFVLKDGAPVPYAQAWAEVEAAVRPVVEQLPDTPVPSQWLGKGFLARRKAIFAYHARVGAARGKLLRLFPVAVPVGDDAVVFVINSCTPVSRHPATNALGRVGRSQYRRLNALARALPRLTKVIALHHHVVRRSEEQSHGLVARIFAKFMVLSDAQPLVRFCEDHGVRLVLNGHRHLSYQLRLRGGTVLIAAPSSTFGDELAHDPRPTFERYDLAATVTEPTVGIFRRVIRA
jgi:hypothetical protein